jgi:protein MpaA
MSHHFAQDPPGRKNFRETLAPLHRTKAPWLTTVLGSWAIAPDDYSLEQFLFVGPRGGGDYCRVGIFAGTHGDEVAGVLAAVRFLHELAENPALAQGYEIYVYPLCNPTGFEDGTRHSRGGRDLNREFWTGSREPEVQLLEQQIRTLRFEHVVEPALQAAEKIVPRNRDPKIDNFTARNGLIRKGYTGMLCAAPETRPRPFEIVLETPLRAELELQVEANVVFLRHALEQYLQLRAIGQDL